MDRFQWIGHIAVAFLLFVPSYVGAGKLDADYNVKLSLSFEPEAIVPGSNFLLKCTESALPEPDQYTVTFYLNSSVLCRYRIDTRSDNFQFESLAPPLLNVFPSRHSNYEVLVQPNTVHPLGTFQCSIHFNSKRNGNYPLWYYSNLLDTNSVLVHPKAIVPQASVGLSLINENAGLVMKCHLNLTPNGTNYRVAFLMESVVQGEYSVIATQSTPLVYWNKTTDYDTVNLYRGSQSAYPDFSVFFQRTNPHNSYHTVQFQCLLKVQLPLAGGEARFFSNSDSRKIYK